MQPQQFPESPQEAAIDVIAVGAHPDDVEIACGGTLATLIRQGYRVGIIDLTDGEPTPLCPDPAIRLAEAEAAAEVLGVTFRKILPLTNRRLFDSFEARIALATEFRRYRPRIVIGFGSKTPMASPDHYQAMQITDAAVFYSRLTKWDDYFAGLPVHTITSQLYFHLGFEAMRSPEFSSQFTVDISQQLETKLQAILCYQTQFPPEKQRTLDRVRGIAIAAGSAAGFAAGEVFTTTRPLGCTDLVKTAIPLVTGKK
ncbi:MAG: PIG-L family deacetylase [Planctomycetales bacterium]|nr:PIG-L family deacetylase [Planctomycetales bacterium]